jgi:hypothetical protein
MTRSTVVKRRRRDAARLGLALASVVPFATASAAWDTQSDITMGMEANDNPRLGQAQRAQPQNLLAERDHTAMRALVDARFRLSNYGQRGQIFLQPRIRADRYSDPADEDLQRKDAYLYSRGSYRWERGDAGVAASFSRESILSSEIIDTGLGDINGDGIIEPIEGTGQLVLLDEHRDRLYAAPYANFAISSRSTVGLEANYLDVTYGGGALVQTRSDFTESLFGMHLTRTIDERTAASARVYASDFSADATHNDTRTVGVEGSFDRHLNEIWSFAFALGVERSAFTYLGVDGTTIDNADANFTLNLGFAKRTDVSTLNFNLRRAADPSATGFLTERDEFQILYSRRMSERLTANFALRALQERTLSHAEREAGRDIGRLSFGIAWAFAPTWSIGFGYDAVAQRFTEAQRPDGNSNILSIGIIYQGRSKQEQR